MRKEETDAINRIITEEWKRQQTVDLLRALTVLCGSGMLFRPQQEEAIRAIMDGKSPVATVMVTRVSKSLLFMLPAAYSPVALIVVVIPLILLQGDLQQRCCRLSIKYAEWNAERRRQPDDVLVVLVIPELALTDEFSTFLNRMRASHRLEHIVFNKYYLILDGGRQSF
jgi:superfamily II DNA helicase RecQ